MSYASLVFYFSCGVVFAGAAGASWLLVEGMGLRGIRAVFTLVFGLASVVAASATSMEWYQGIRGFEGLQFLSIRGSIEFYSMPTIVVWVIQVAVAVVGAGIVRVLLKRSSPG